MAIAERLIIANYDSLDNKPIINQDLTALGFVPVANTYYRHTGNTTSRFTKGLIYKYDGTQFKELGTGQEVDLSHYIRVEDLTGLLPNVQYALVHNADNEFTLVEVESGEGGTGWLVATNETEVNALLVDENLGKFFMYIGTPADGLYAYALYQIVEQEGSIDKALVYISAEDISTELTAIFDELSTKQDKATLEQDVADLGFTKNVGTVTGITMNGESKQVENGIVDLGTVITEHQELKTVNGESIVGEGNIQIDGVTDYDELENQPIINQYEESEPAPVNGKYYKRPDGDLYKYVEAIVPEHLIALEHNKEVHKGFKVRFNKNLDIDTFLNGLTFPEGYPMLQLYNIGFADGEHDNERALEQLAIMDAGAMSAKLGEDAKGIILVAGIDRILYATESGAIMGMDAVTQEAITISYTQGWNTNFVDENGDYEPQFISAVYGDNPHYSTFEDGILGISNQLNQELWNGVLVGEFAPEEDKSFYDKVVLESELGESGGLPDSTNAKDGDALRVKVTPEVVGFINPVEVIEGGTQNDIFINTKVDVDFSKFNLTDMLMGEIPCEELIKFNLPGKVLTNTEISSGNTSAYFLCNRNDNMIDSAGNSITSLCESYWNTFSGSVQTDTFGFDYLDVITCTSDDNRVALRLYHIDNNWVFVANANLPETTDILNNKYIWSSATFNITIKEGVTDPVDIYFNQGTHNLPSNRSIFYDSCRLTYDTNIFGNLLYAKLPVYCVIVATNYRGANIIFNFSGASESALEFTKYGFIWSEIALGSDMPAGWSQFLEYASGSHENGIISYLRGFMPLTMEMELPEGADLLNNITYVSDNPVVRDIFGSTRDTEVLSPEKKEIGWGLPFPDITKSGQVLTSACDEYNLTYDYIQAHEDAPIQSESGFEFNTELSQSDVDSAVTLMSANMSEYPIQVMKFPDYIVYGIHWGVALRLNTFSVNQTFNNQGVFFDASKLEEAKSFLRWLSAGASVTTTYPLMYSSDSNLIYAEYVVDTGVTTLYINDSKLIDTDTTSFESEPFVSLPSGATVTGINDNSYWNGVFFYCVEQKEDGDFGVMLGSKLEHNTDTFNYEILYSAGSGKVLVYSKSIAQHISNPLDVYKVVDIENRWYEENFNIVQFSGMYMFDSISSNYQGAARVYGKLVTLQPGLFYGDIGNAHVEWGEANSKVKPEDYETSYPDELYYLMGEGHNGKDLKRYNYDAVKNNISSYVSNNIQLKTINNNSLRGYGNIEISGSITPSDYPTDSKGKPSYVYGDNGSTVYRYEYSNLASDINDNLQLKTINNESLRGSGNIEISVPTYYTGSFTLYSSNWSSYNDGYRYTYSFSYYISSDDTLMIAPNSASDATKAQEANVYFAEPTYAGSSQIYFYASEQPQNDISFKYTFIDLN